MALKLKIDENGAVSQSEDGHPIYIDDTDGKEIPVNVDQLFTKINNLNTESKDRRLKVKDLSDRLAPLEGIEDIGAFVTTAREAIEKVETAGMDEGKLKEKFKESYEGKIALIEESKNKEIGELSNKLEAKDSVIRRLLISSEFAKSGFFAGDDAQTFLTPVMAEKIWGENFKVEEIADGDYRAVGYDLNGQQILSRENPGEPAGFKEAIASLVDSHPDKARFMRGGKPGSGSQGNTSPAGTSSDVGVLVNQYKKARETGDTSTCLAIKRRLAEIGHPNAVL